jgi:putative restriction endonuclease
MDSRTIMATSNTPRHGRDWTRDELVLALELYRRIGVRRDRNDRAVRELAAAIGRTPDSVAMKLHNFEAVDPSISRKALEITGRLDEVVFGIFSSKPDLLHDESDKIRARLSETEALSDPGTQDELRRINRGSYRVEDGEALTKVRRGQAAFAKVIKSNYRAACAICGLELPELLTASHIKPWADDPDHRLDPSNGLCLCSVHDRLFDRGLITLSRDLRVVVSRDLKTAQGHGAREIVAAVEGVQLRAPLSHSPDEQMLNYHRQAIFRGH